MTISKPMPQADEAGIDVILAPTEGSDSEKRALSVAVRLARKHGARLHLLRVEATPYVGESIRRDGSEIDTGAPNERNVSRDELEILAAACRAAARIPVVGSFEMGPVGRTITEYARKSGADLIVMASHSRGGRTRTALGSVTEYVVRRANIPVLAVKPGASFIGPTTAESFSTIVVPLDGSGLSEQIVPEAKKLAKILGSTIRLVHVLKSQMRAQEQIADPVFAWWEDERGTVHECLELVAADLAASGIPVATDVLLNDDIPAAILAFAERVGAGIIAVATSGSVGINQVVFGCVADEIFRRSPVSLLAFHPVVAKTKSYIEDTMPAHSFVEN